MVLFFQEERDKDFLETCETVRRESRYLSMAEIARKAVYTETPSFYLSGRGCAKIINRFRKGHGIETKSTAKKALYADLFRLYKTIESVNPGITAAEIARKIITQKAPRFYITESRAKDLYYTLIKDKSIK